MELATQIFLDSGDPVETKEADQLLKRAGFPGVQGQTTNPSLIAKYLGKSLISPITQISAADFYRQAVVNIAKFCSGPISIQIMANLETSVDDMLSQAREKIKWIPNGVIKFPVTTNGLAAAQAFCQEGPVNLTLVFSQEQAAAVYQATLNTKYPVFISPFVGRLDDRGECGMDIVANILKMLQTYGDSHLKVITASVRSIDHLLYALYLKSDVISVPFNIINNWLATGNYLPDKSYGYDAKLLRRLPYQDIKLDQLWTNYNIDHALTTAGVAKFWSDWESILNKS